MEHDLYQRLAAAFVRGRLAAPPGSPDELIEQGRAAGLRLHKFKRSQLPRVHKVLGILRGLQPDTLLDIGCGRGAFLWPLLDAFPDLPVTTVDVDPQRVADVNAVAAGGVPTVQALQGDVLALDLAERQFDIVTALEVIEHLEVPEQAVQRLCRVATRFVIASVPSKPDDNPQHIQFFTPETFRDMFERAGAQRVTIEHVPNHMIAVARVT